MEGRRGIIAHKCKYDFLVSTSNHVLLFTALNYGLPLITVGHIYKALLAVGEQAEKSCSLHKIGAGRAFKLLRTSWKNIHIAASFYYFLFLTFLSFTINRRELVFSSGS